MCLRILTGILLALAAVPRGRAADVEGTIIIRHTLTRRKVAVSPTAYERGVAVQPATAEITDPLAFERTHVVIYLEGDLPGKPVTVNMEQNHRQFLPDTLTIPAGSTVSFPNLDPIFHNVFSLSKPKTFDLGNYAKGQTRKVTFPKPGIVFVNCHLHPNMAAVIFVTPNQWTTIADQDGRFALANVPKGRREIVAWHKTAGFFRQTVDVDENHSANIRFVIPIDENGQTISQR